MAHNMLPGYTLHYVDGCDCHEEKESWARRCLPVLPESTSVKFRKKWIRNYVGNPETAPMRTLMSGVLMRDYQVGEVFGWNHQSFLWDTVYHHEMNSVSDEGL